MLEHLPIGKRKAISRNDLVFVTGYCDRRVRKEIEKLQEEGYPVCNCMENGYYIAGSEKEFDEYIRIIKAYEKSIIEKRKNLEEIKKTWEF